MKIRNIPSGEDIGAKVIKISRSDFKLIKKDGRFEFDWDEYSDKDVYKLVITSSNEILGLICLTDRPEFGFECVEIDALCTRNDQRGKHKTYDYVAGCLLAFAARESFNNGFDGYVSLVSKTKTVSIYEEYGFDNNGNVGTPGIRMSSDSRNSRRLIELYFSNTEKS